MQAPEHVTATATRMRARLCAWAGTPSKGNIAATKLPAWLRANMPPGAAPHLQALAQLSTAWLVAGQCADAPAAPTPPTPTEPPALALRFPDGRDGNDALVVVGGSTPLWAVYTNSRMQISLSTPLEPTQQPAPASYPPPYVLELRTAALRAVLAAAPQRECPNPNNAPAPVRLGGGKAPCIGGSGGAPSPRPKPRQQSDADEGQQSDDPFYFPAVPEYSKKPYEQLAATFSTPRAPDALTPADYERIVHAAYAANTWAPLTPSATPPLQQQGYADPSGILASFRLADSPPGACHYTWVRVETRPAKGQPARTSIALVARLPHLRLNPVLFEAGVGTGASSMGPPCDESTLHALRQLC